MSAHVGTLAPSIRHRLAEVEGHGYGVVVECSAARRRLHYRSQLDGRSDAQLQHARHALEQLLAESHHHLASLALEHLRRGIALDGAEDAPCAEAAVCVERAAAEGRAIGTLVEAAVSCGRCGLASCGCGRSSC